MEQKPRQTEIQKCNHIKTNGMRCGSPALRGRRFCYFHHRAHDLRQLRHQRPGYRFELPLLEDANAVQMSLQDVLSAVNEDRIDHRRAGLLLYGLSTAASNLKQVNLEPRELREQADSAALFEDNEIARCLLDAILKGSGLEDAESTQPSAASSAAQRAENAA